MHLDRIKYRSRRFKQVLMYLSVVAFILLTACSAWLNTVRLQVDKEEAVALFGQNGTPVKSYFDRSADYTIHSVQVGDTTKPAMIFVHGAPSSLSGFKSYLQDSLLLQKYLLVAVDRPGYGLSDFGKVDYSILHQAQALSIVIDRYAHQGKKVKLVGSSYGGPVVGAMAMLRPESVSEVVFISASVKPKAEKTYWISYPFSYYPLKWWVPALIQVANEEKLNHQVALEELAPYWSHIKARVTIMHGQKDDLIYYENAIFLRDQLGHTHQTLISLPEDGHYLPWQKKDLVIKVLQGTLERN